MEGTELELQLPEIDATVSGIVLRPSPPRALPVCALVLGVVVATLLAPGHASAQDTRILGRVLEDDTGRPLQGVLVTLRNEDGEVIENRLTSPSGSFVFSDIDGGSYIVAADMIGYAERRTETIRVEDGQSRSLQLGLPVSAIQLDGLDVSGERRCGMDAREGQTLARLWTEIREALQRASFTGGVPFAYEVEAFTRRRSRNATGIHGEDRRNELIVSGVPFVSIEPEILGERGYVFRNAETGRIDFYGPDADVLLSDTFSETHCFEIEEGDDENEGLLGLHFEPLDDRDLPEIEGVLWVNPETLRLSHVDYRFRNVLRGPRERHLGGRVDYTELPNGLWIIREWYLRIPVVTISASDAWGRRRSRFRHNDLTAIHEVGGVVKLVRDPEGEPILDAESGLVRGVVESRATGEPVEGMVVRLGETGRLARTNEAGEFRFTSVPEGSYLFQLEDGEGNPVGRLQDRAAPGVQTFVRFVVGG